jgi:hypothetical protein
VILTVREIATIEQVSERQVQRYISEGFQGHKLPATRTGKRLTVTAEDYKAWRTASGFERPEASPQVSLPASSGKLPEEPPATSGNLPEHTSPFRPARLDGVITNVPHKDSSSMPAPETCLQYLQENARKLREDFGE